jgi:hypothetical protein
MVGVWEVENRIIVDTLKNVEKAEYKNVGKCITLRVRVKVIWNTLI